MEKLANKLKGQNRIKVGLMTMEFLNPWGGIGTYCLDLCKALSDKVKYHVFTCSQKIEYLQSVNQNFGLDVEVHTICKESNIPFTNLKYQLILAASLSRFISEYDLDLVHFGSSWAVQLFRIGGSDFPNVITCHSTLQGQRYAITNSGSRFKDLHSSEKLTILLYPLLKSYESYNLSRTGHIIATSKTLRNELINNYHFKGEVTVIQNGIDIHKFKPNKAAVDIGVEKSGKTRILFSGRLIALKGPQFVIKAMPLVLRQYPEVVFIFAGPGNRTPYLQMLRDLKIPEKNFEFCHLSYENMPQLYNSADILVLPSLTEGFPKCILEGMACGLPVIASDVGDVSELVHDGSTGFLISKGDYKTLADRINLLQSNENLRHQMSLDARSMVVANYSVDVMSQKTLDTYQKCIGCSAK